MVLAMTIPDYLGIYGARKLLFENDLFRSTSLYREYIERQFGFADIGGRGGVHPIIKGMGPLANVASFDADPSACLGCADQFDRNASKLHVYPYALGRESGPATLHITKNPAASSLLKPNLHYVDRYRVTPAEPTGSTLNVTLRSLDELMLSKGVDIAWENAELLKLDVQGYELEVLRGASETIKRATVAIFCEVEFFQLYENQPLFSDIETYLRQCGFSFFGFYNSSYKSSRKINKEISPLVRERLYWADAVFFRDPLRDAVATGGGACTLSKRALFSLIVSAMLLEYYDYALEVADFCATLGYLDANEIQNLGTVCHQLAAFSIQARTDSLARVMNSLTDMPQNGSKVFSDLVDEWRFYADHREPLKS